MALFTRTPSRRIAMPVPQEPLRRCTFRRVTAIQTGRKGVVYDVACLFPDRQRPFPIGDLESARAVCGSCVAEGTFRADSD